MSKYLKLNASTKPTVLVLVLAFTLVVSVLSVRTLAIPASAATNAKSTSDVEVSHSSQTQSNAMIVYTCPLHWTLAQPRCYVVIKVAKTKSKCVAAHETWVDNTCRKYIAATKATLTNPTTTTTAPPVGTTTTTDPPVTTTTDGSGTTIPTAPPNETVTPKPSITKTVKGPNSLDVYWSDTSDSIARAEIDYWVSSTPFSTQCSGLLHGIAIAANPPLGVDDGVGTLASREFELPGTLPPPFYRPISGDYVQVEIAVYDLNAPSSGIIAPGYSSCVDVGKIP
jgi:hypothetical protein